MDNVVKKIRTASGDAQIDYEALANLPKINGQVLKGDIIISGGSGGSGVTFIPTVDAEGNLSWTNNGGLPNPDTVNIKGPTGDTPVKGIDYWTPADQQAIVAAVLASFTDASEVAM